MLRAKATQKTAMPSILMMVSSSPLQDRTWDDLLIILTEPTRPGGATHPNTRMIIVEVGPDLIDYIIEENGLKEIGRMIVGPEDLREPFDWGQEGR
jgi:hypothetical protein